MTEAAFPNGGASARAKIESRLRKRYAAERRFRACGIMAIGVAIAALVVLVGSIGAQGVPAFTAWKLALDVHVDPARIAGDPADPAVLRRADYGAMIQDALRAEFPQETEAAKVRELLGLYTRLNSVALQRRVAADPTLIGATIRFEMPISDELDRYLKGQVTGRTWLDLREGWALAPLPAVDDGAPAARVTLGPDDAARILAATETDGPLDAGAPSVLLFAPDGAVWRLDGTGTDAGAQRLTAPSGAAAFGAVPGGAARALVLSTPAADRRVSDGQIAWTEILKSRGEVKRAFNTTLFANADSREPELAGVRAALIGSILTMMVTMILSVPVGIATAIYLEEFAPKNRWTDLVEVNINNLAAVPSIVFGLLGLAVFVQMFGMPRSAPILGGLVLALMTLPVVIIASRAALKAVPPSIREAALSVGASRTQAVFGHVLPLAVPGVMTGAIIGMARALGETAPLLMVGMVAFVADVPRGFTSPATVMPVQVFIWGSSAERAFEARTAAAIIILLALMVAMNALAIFLRRKFERRW